jgi:hypothetical protein
LAIFEKADPDVQAQKAAESALRAKRRDRDSLGERLGIAETAIASYRAQARQLAADGADDKEINKAEGKMRDAQDRVQTLTGAIGDLDKIIAGLEREIDQIVDKRCRAETSIAVNTMADRIAKAQAAHEAAALELELAAKEGGLLIPESLAVHQFVLSAREQLKPAIAMITASLGAHAKAVLSGHAPGSLPRPAPPPVKLAIVPSEPTTNLFVVRNIRYVASDGDVVCCGKNRRHDLPVRIGELALAAGAAVPLSDRKRVEAFEGTSGMYVPTPQACEWVGPKGREPAPLQMKPGPAPVHHSLTEFTPLDRGKPFIATMARPAEPEPMPLAAGARNLAEE